MADYHLIGVGGTGMSSLAILLAEKGYSVSGSDSNIDNLLKNKLQKNGIIVYSGHSPDNVREAKEVVISSAIHEGNIELREAMRRGIKVLHRVEALKLLTNGKRLIAVSGSHGKGTTTGMLGFIFRQLGLDPSFYCGAELINYGASAWWGKGKYFIVETDESDGSFLKLKPWITLILNVDGDHLNFWGHLGGLKKGFLKLLERSEYCVLSDQAQEEIRTSSSLIYGESDGCHFCLKETKFEEGEQGAFFSSPEGNFNFQIPLLGEHNALNALAAITVSYLVGLPLSLVLQALRNYKGIRRRLEPKGEVKGVLVYDDYAHHPAEIVQSLKALSSFKRRLVCVFQPHRYSRLRDFKENYGLAFAQADLVFILPVFSAGEELTYGLSGKEVKDSIIKTFPRKEVYFLSPEEIYPSLRMTLHKGDLLVFLGPGDIAKLSERALEELND